jgi:hypothetical protein
MDRSVRELAGGQISQADKALGQTKQKNCSPAALVCWDSGQIRKTAVLLPVCWDSGLQSLHFYIKGYF